MYPLVLDLAADKIPVAVTCRVLGFSTQAFYAWRKRPVCRRDYDDAHLINTALDIHQDDPGFGYRFIADELSGRGVRAGRNRVHRLCSQQRIWSVHARKRGLSRKPGPPVHDDLVTRVFTAPRPDQLWLTDITEHPTGEGTLYLCAIKDACSNRIVGYSMDHRMTADLAVTALRNAVALARSNGHRGALGSGQPVPVPRVRPGPSRTRSARLHGQGRCLCRQRRDGVFLQPAAEERSQPAALESPRATPPGDHHLDRKDLPPKPSTPYDSFLQGIGDLYVDERVNARHIYFTFYDGTTGGVPDIYKLVEPTPDE